MNNQLTKDEELRKYCLEKAIDFWLSPAPNKPKNFVLSFPVDWAESFYRFIKDGYEACRVSF